LSGLCRPNSHGISNGGLEEKIKDVRLVGDMLGEVEVQNASAEELAQAEEIINKIEGYHTI